MKYKLAATTAAMAGALALGACGTPPDDSDDVNVRTTSLGDVLVDQDGYTLYMFEEAKCNAACLVMWPRATSTDGVLTQSDEVNADVNIEEKWEQLVIDGEKLYTFAKDEQPGDVKGQGVGGKWWVVNTSGNPVKVKSSELPGY